MVRTYTTSLFLTASTLLVLVVLVACGGTSAQSVDTDGDSRPDATVTPTATITSTLAAAPPPPVPTSNVVNLNQGIPLQTVMDLPAGWMLDLAVHPTQNWAAVCYVNRIFDGPFRAWYRVYDPQQRRWTTAQQLDTNEASNGFDRWSSSRVAITGDGTVHALFGPADEAEGDRWGNYPGWSSASGLQYRASSDNGRTWTPPVSREPCTNQGMAGSRDGWVAALLLCGEAGHTPADDTPQHQPTPVPSPTTSGGDAGGVPQDADLWLARRTPDGTWLDAVPLPIEQRGFLFVDLVLLDDDDTTVMVAVVVESDGLVIGLRYPLPDGPLTVTSRPMDDTMTSWRPAGTGYTRSETDPTTGVTHMRPSATFVWHGWDRAQVLAMHTFDAGHSWVGPEIVVDRGEADGMPLRDPAAVYDPDADRLAVLWLNGGDEGGTHEGAWSEPGRGDWHETGIIGTGALEATMSAAAQPANVATFWLAWHERSGTIRARTMRVRDIVPETEYQP